MVSLNTPAARHAAPRRSWSLPERYFRPELHGVRGLALALVVLFHVLGDGRISGGIDIFLAITGYLFTQSLLRRAVEGRGKIDFRHHYARIAQRLLPPVLVALAGIVVATFLWAPPSGWLQIFREVRASALYFENWELIYSQLDYNAAGPESSPLQHFWSLSIQGQFHLVWPFVMVLVAVAARRSGLSPVKVALGTLGGLFAVSFAFALWLTHVNQPVAYFHTGARLWEFALGGLAALVLPHVRLPARVRTALGWIGLAMILSCGFLFGTSDGFPGLVSLWPVTGLMLILAGSSGSRMAVERVLVTRPLRFVADISYALYLWHWPVLVFFLMALDREQIGARGALLILATSVLLAWLTTVILNGTVYAWLARVDLAVRVRTVAATVVLLVVATASPVIWLDMRQEQALAATLAGAAESPGAAALVLGDANPEASLDPDKIIPLPEVIDSDLPEIYSRECVQNSSSSPAYDEVLVCDDEVADATQTVVMTGGSHVQQWWPAMADVAERNSWNLIVVDKDGCQLTADRDGSLGSPQNAGCYRWNDDAVDVIIDLEPDAVFTLGSTTRGMAERVPEGFVEVWRQLGRAGIDVLTIRDTVRLPESVPECIDEHGFEPVRCGVARGDIYLDDYPGLTDVPDNVVFTDMTEYLCDDVTCPSIVGNVIVYRDKSHVTATYMRTLAPFLENELRADAPWLFDGSGS